MKAPGNRRVHMISITLPENMIEKLKKIPKGQRSAFVAYLLDRAKVKDYVEFTSTFS
jgi:hypothetical protein